MCKHCFEDRKQTYTTFTVDVNGSIIVVKNVPCLECEVCGETTFTSEVSQKLERIVNDAKKLSQEISVIDYKKIA